MHIRTEGRFKNKLFSRFLMNNLMNKDTLKILNGLGLEPDRVIVQGRGKIVFDQITIDSLFDVSTRYTDIERVVTNMFTGGRSDGKPKQDLALEVNGKLFTEEYFSVWINYCPRVWEGEVELGEKEHENYGTVILVMNRGLKRLEDYLFKCQAAQQQYNYTYRSRTEIKP